LSIGIGVLLLSIEHSGRNKRTMSDEETLVAEAAATEAAQSAVEAQVATAEAQAATRDAELATAMAAGASVAQAQLVGQVMEAGREDANQAAIDAEIAAQEAESAADDAVTTNVAVLAQMQSWQRSVDERITAMEAHILSRNATPEPAQEEATPTEEQVTEINPEAAAEPEAEAEAAEATEGTRTPSRNRRRGKRRRR
jgi:hypothetical protein